MATPDTTILSPDQATALVRGAFDGTSNSLPLNDVLPNTSNAEGLQVSWEANTRVEDDEMPFSAFDAEAPYGKTTGAGATKMLKLMPLRKRMRTTEMDIIMNRGNSADWQRDKLTEYFQQLGTEAAFRLERARADTIVNAKLDISENGLKGVSYDFERDSSLEATLNTGKKWSDSTVNPIKDIKAWKDKIKAVDGDKPTLMLTTTTVMDALAENPFIIKFAATTEPDLERPQVAYQNVINVFKQYAGVTPVTVDDQYDAYLRTQRIKFKGGVETFFPENTVILLPGAGGGLGETAIGPTAETSITGYDIAALRNGFIGAVFSSIGNQPGYEAYVTGTGLPVLRMANSTFKATVM